MGRAALPEAAAAAPNSPPSRARGNDSGKGPGGDELAASASASSSRPLAPPQAPARPSLAPNLAAGRGPVGLPPFHAGPGACLLAPSQLSPEEWRTFSPSPSRMWGKLAAGWLAG